MAMDGAGGSVLTPFEAEAYVEQLEIFDMKSIGNAKWLQQHEFLEKLNVQVRPRLYIPQPPCNAPRPHGTVLLC